MLGPYPWMGAKFYEKKWIFDLMPKHSYYYEVFFGSGILLLNKPPADESFANDINSRLVNFWLCLQDEELMLKLQKKCSNSLDSRYIYQMEMMKWKGFDNILDKETLDNHILEMAYNFLYLVKFGFNSYPNTYYTPLTHKMYKIKNFSRTFRLTAKRLPKYFDVIKDVRFTNYDFKEFLDKCDPCEGKFLFLDPPYYKTHQYNRDYGIDSPFEEKDYLDMRDRLEIQTEGGSLWMITCNQTNPFFDDMKNIHIKLVDRRACINKNKDRKDVKTKIIMNYDIHKTGRVWLNNEKSKQGDNLLI